MGLATIDPHSKKEYTEIRKIPKFGVNRPNGKQDTAIWNVKIYKEMYGHPDAVRHGVRMAIHFFVNFDVFKPLYLSQNLPDYHQTWGFYESQYALSDYVDQ